ncbi:MAG: SH3 domain-containing protein [Rhodospirillaceae bacterium]|nr:SH3 domain-containing protein [Rhodospirillaceae bacterium]
MTMLRTCAALAAAVLISGTAGAKELKPKFGNIDGVYYSDVASNRDACRQAIKNKIALCRQNTNFESNTKNRKYKGCLPIFRRQAQSCVVHFRHQMGKCNLSGAARITDFTGFGCEATRTVVEEDGGPDISPLDRRMTARTRVNLRAGPGTNHRVVGSLAAGQAVQATGRAGDWLRISLQGRTAFVHGQFMVGVAGQDRTPARGGTAETDRLRKAIAVAERKLDAARSRYRAAERAHDNAMQAYAAAASRIACDNLRGRPHIADVANSCQRSCSGIRADLCWKRAKNLARAHSSALRSRRKDRNKAGSDVGSARIDLHQLRMQLKRASGR